MSLSQREAVASSTMSGICDNFLNAFAIHLNATVPQIAWLTAVPQLLGAWLQLASVWIGLHCTRKRLIVAGGYLAVVLPTTIELGRHTLRIQSPLLGVFALSGLLRLAVALWFLPRAEEPRVQRRPTVRELVVGLVRSLPFTRIVRDWLTSRRKRG